MKTVLANAVSGLRRRRRRHRPLGRGSPAAARRSPRSAAAPCRRKGASVPYRPDGSSTGAGILLMHGKHWFTYPTWPRIGLMPRASPTTVAADQAAGRAHDTWRCRCSRTTSWSARSRLAARRIRAFADKQIDVDSETHRPSSNHTWNCPAALNQLRPHADELDSSVAEALQRQQDNKLHEALKAMAASIGREGFPTAAGQYFLERRCSPAVSSPCAAQSRRGAG